MPVGLLLEGGRWGGKREKEREGGRKRERWKKVSETEKKKKRKEKNESKTFQNSRFALGLVTLESIPTIPFCCLPMVSAFQLEGYSKEYLEGSS
jgi:hypothetical protein